MKKTSPLRYSIGMFGGSLPFNMFTAFMAFFYVNNLGMDMRIFSASLLIYSIVDAFDSPLYGYLSDRTRSRFGRRKPWLLAASILFALSFVAFFNPPDALGQGALVVYFIVTMLLVQTTMSMVQVNYNALLPDLFRTKSERARANSMRQAWMFAATILGVALTPVISDAIGFPLTAAIFGVISIVALVFMTLGCRENPDYNDYMHPAFFSSLKEIVKSKKFWQVASVGTLYSAAQSLLLAAIPFYIVYALELEGAAASVLLGTVFVTATVMLFPWAAAVRRFSLLPVWRAALLTLAVSFIPMFFVGNLVGAVIGGFFVGVGLGGIVSTNDIVIALLLDEDKDKYTQRREGIYQSFLRFANHLSGFILSGAFFMAVFLFGFISGDEPGPNPGGAARFLLVVVPVVLMFTAFVISLFLKQNNESEGQHEISDN